MENAGNLLMKQKCIDKGCMESLVTSAGRFDLVVVLWILGDYIIVLTAVLLCFIKPSVQTTQVWLCNRK